MLCSFINHKYNVYIYILYLLKNYDKDIIKIKTLWWQTSTFIFKIYFCLFSI